LYSEGKVRRILAEAKVTEYEWIELDRDFIVAAHL
jgi:hypothetical protein